MGISDYLHSTEAGLRLAIVPMSVISLLQQLRLLKVEANLTTAWMLLPWHASSPYQWAWLPGSSMLPVGTRLFYTMLSPITLRFFSQVSSDWIHNFGNFVRDYGRQPAILGPKAPQTDKADHAADCQKRTSFLLRPLVFLRDELLDLTGWSYWSYLDGPNQGVLRARSLGAMLALDDRDDEGPVDAETSSDVEPYLLPQARRRFQRMSSKNGRPSRKAWPKFKTTRLSMLPADILGHRLHEVVWTILKAPINILLYRSLVCAWQVQTLGSATLPDAPGNGRLGAFGRALLSNLKNEKWGALAARMGLCLAAEAVVDALVWGGVYCFASSFGVGEKRSQRLPPEHLST
ncbi:hypothetical protein ANO11243_005530 [Dothideomycetidae sp. 11243]|nr:hypothetical protein ANO11243_005530 [fungal sp. No.11243]